MELCVGNHTYLIFTAIFLSSAYGVHYLEPVSISAHVISLVFAIAGLYVAQKAIPRGRVKPDGKAVFITGCDTGLGHKLALRCDQIGLRVFAGCLYPDGIDARKLSSQGSDRLTIIPCDVTSGDSVVRARDLVCYAVIKEQLTLWACVNNAGIHRYGEIDMVPMQVFKQVMEVNTFGMVRVTKAFIPIVRQTKGRFVNVTSVAGRWCNPTNTPYCMSKFAAETFSDVLRYEMHKWGVKVSIVEPGPYGGTTMISRFLNSDKGRADFIWCGMDEATREVYGREYVDKIQEAVAQALILDCYQDNTPVIDAMIDAILSRYPKHRYAIGGLLAPAVWGEFWRYDLMPTWLSDSKMLKAQEGLGKPVALQNEKE